MQVTTTPTTTPVPVKSVEIHYCDGKHQGRPAYPIFEGPDALVEGQRLAEHLGALPHRRE